MDNLKNILLNEIIHSKDKCDIIANVEPKIKLTNSDKDKKQVVSERNLWEADVGY